MTAPVQDRDVTVEVVVRVTVFGRPEGAEDRVVKKVAHDLYLAFGDRYEIVKGGERIVYDHLADDGHHPGHSEVLRRQPIGEPGTNGRRSP